MTNPDIEWIVAGPGILELPTTKFLIEYVVGETFPFRVTWDGHPIPGGSRMRLEDAKEDAVRHMAELIMMGFEV